MRLVETSSQSTNGKSWWLPALLPSICRGLAFVDCQVSTGTVLPGELLNFLPSLG